VGDLIQKEKIIKSQRNWRHWKVLTFHLLKFIGASENQTTKGNQMSSKVKAIHHKRDLIEAVRKVAPASLQLSPALFRDISSNLKTVSVETGSRPSSISLDRH
jgi:hypothetical protein